MKNTKLIFFFAISFLFLNCKKDFEELSNNEQKQLFRSKNKTLLEVSYDITTFRDFDVNRDSLSDLDLASVNPRNERQKVNLQLFENGEIRLEIENVDFKEKIIIPHKTLPNTEPSVHRTIIQGNTVNFYDRKGTLLGAENIPIKNNIDLVNKMKEMGEKLSPKEIDKLISTMNGINFIDDLNGFINNAQRNNIIITNQGNGIITARLPLSEVAPGMTEQTVLLIDKNRNKFLGTRTYDEQNQLLQSVLFAYNKGETQSLKAIRVKQLFYLPSGIQTYMINLSKIDNLKFNINI